MGYLKGFESVKRIFMIYFQPCFDESLKFYIFLDPLLLLKRTIRTPTANIDTIISKPGVEAAVVPELLLEEVIELINTMYSLLLTQLPLVSFA